METADELDLRPQPKNKALHLLCKHCKALCKNSKFLNRKASEVLVEKERLEKEEALEIHSRGRELVPHYPGYSDILRGKAGGCHLCSIVLASLLGAECPDPSLEEPGPIVAVIFEDSHVQYLSDRDGLTGHDWHHVKPTTPQVGNFVPILNQKSLCFRGFDINLSSEGDNIFDEHDFRTALDTWAEIFSQIQNWIKACLQRHDACRNVFSKDQPDFGNIHSVVADFKGPTRLLDLNHFPPRSPDIRLVETGGCQRTLYATLSYCWGKGLGFKVTRANYHSCLEHISYNNLPQTFRDAIVTTRRLGVGYLWIDALCIIQGDEEDWTQEAPRMHSIYAGSSFTIAARNGSSSAEGFLYDYDRTVTNACNLLKSGDVQFWAIIDHCFSGSQGRLSRSSQLDSRGWVLQERLFSPSTLHFGRDFVRFECREDWCCPLPHGTVENSCLCDDTGRLKNIYKELMQKNDFWELWKDLIQRYTSTNLTFPGDKLLAIASVGGLIQDRFLMRASFGIWNDNFLLNLLWKAIRGPCEPNPNRAPSWSWASLDGHIGFPLEIQSSRKYPTRVSSPWTYSATLVRAPEETSFNRTEPPDP